MVTTLPYLNANNTAPSIAALNYVSDFGSNAGILRSNNGNIESYNGALIASPSWSISANTLYKISMRWKSSGLKNFLNGVAGTEGGATGGITKGTNLSVGNYGGGVGTYTLGGTIGELTVYSTNPLDTYLTQKTT